MDCLYFDFLKKKDYAGAARVVFNNAASNNFRVGPLWHGGADGFSVFDWEKVGQQGFSEGFGFYFSNKEEVARGYADRHGGRLMSAFLFDAPSFDAKKITISKKDVIKSLDMMHEKEEAIEGYGSFLWNFGDISYEGKGNVLESAARLVLNSSASDVDLLAGLINGGANPQITYDSFYKMTGKSGIVNYDSWGADGHTIHIATSPNHIKLSDVIVRDDDGNIIPPSMRFDVSSPDIRSVSSLGEIMRMPSLDKMISIERNAECRITK